MLLSLVIVEITSFTVACFSLVALLCFFSSIKKSQQKTKKNFGQRRGQNQSVAPPLLLIVPGAVLLPPFPPLRFLTRHRSGGAGVVCRFVKRRNQVFAQFVRPFSSGTAASKIRKVLFLEIVLVEKIITLFRMLSTTFSSLCPPCFSPLSLLPFFTAPPHPSRPLKCC